MKVFLVLICCSLLFLTALSISLPSKACNPSCSTSNRKFSNILLRGGKKKSKLPDIKRKYKKHHINEIDDLKDSLNSPHNTAFDAIDEISGITDVDDESDKDSVDGFDTLKNNRYVQLVLSKWRLIPPMTQVYMGSSIMITVLSAIFNNNKWPEILNLDWKKILVNLQVWRLVTGFLSFGPLDMFYPLNMMYVGDHMSTLEKLNFKTPEDFLMLAVFGAVGLIGVSSILSMPMMLLGHNFMSYMVYIWSRVHEGTDVNYLGLITLKAEMLPWFFCLQSFIMEKGLPVADLVGIAIGHLYFYLSQKKLIKSPGFVKEWFKKDWIKQKYEPFKNNFE